MQRLISYFTDGISSQTLKTMGIEIETQFVDKEGKAIQTRTSQQMLDYLAKNGWSIECRKGDLITILSDEDDNKMFYELGRHNIEISTTTTTPSLALDVARECLSQLYEAAHVVSAKPYFGPIVPSDEDLLIIPDERDAIWLKLDGRSALAPLANTSSIQFTLSVAPQEAIGVLNRLGEQIDSFMTDYPQDTIWKRYIMDSSAGYRSDRYGGPLSFKSLDEYCSALAQHDVVQGTHLVRLSDVKNLNVPLYLRSIWWHFRLKRYGDALCVEVRPMARRRDKQFQQQLEKVLQIIRG